MRQADFNVLVLQAALIAYLIWWFRAPLKRWALARYRIAIEAYREAQEKRRQAEEKKECKDDVAVQKEGKEAKAAVVDEGKKQQAARQRRRPAAKLQDLNAKELLEVVAPASSTSSEVDLHAPDEDEATPHDSHQGDGEDRPKGSLLSRTSEVSIMHELRPGKGDEAVLAAVQLAFSELCSCNLWSTCKQHRLKVSSCVRWTGSDWEAVGILLYRLEPHLLQVVFLGVLPAYRRQHVGRALVKALRELARRDPNCMSIMAVVPEHAEAVHFFKAAGFKRSEPGEHQVMRIDLRRKSSRLTLARFRGTSISEARLTPRWRWTLRDAQRLGSFLATLSLAFDEFGKSKKKKKAPCRVRPREMPKSRPDSCGRALCFLMLCFIAFQADGMYRAIPWYGFDPGATLAVQLMFGAVVLFVLVLYACTRCCRCVLRMDHHCVFTNSCIGLRNQPCFLMFLAVTAFGALLVALASAPKLAVMVLSGAELLEIGHVSLLCVSAMTAVALLWNLLLAQLHGLLRNETAIESKVNWAERRGSPYDRGCAANVREVFRCAFCVPDFVWNILDGLDHFLSSEE
ncbi:unnamed protein product [Effrenium voratum]|nr:unnamed protein product [Effrenium voratum]